MNYSTALSDVTAAHAAFLPPRRVPISVGATENLRFEQVGIVPGPWSAEKTPYMVEPMNMLASRRHEAVVFIGPARCGKTASLLLGWMAHNVVNDPGDMLFVQMTQDKAREFSKTDIDRAIRHSPSVSALMGGRQDDNTHDKMFRHGMWLRIGWPSVSNVSGSTYRYVAITDLDRMSNAENVDGEGPLWKLALKRTQTYMSRGMTLIESSPGIELTDPHWQQASAHEAPPATGIVGIYNQSDRRRLYWKCTHCRDWFEPKPGLDLFGLPSEGTLLEIVRETNIEEMATEFNRIVCPHCRGLIGPRAKTGLNLGAKWILDGQIITKSDEIVGNGMESSIAGFWMGGIPAAYQSWRSIVLRYLQALRHFALTNDEETLRATVNTDQGMPYMSRHLRDVAQMTVDPASKKEKSLQRFVVPDETRLVIVNVDVQAGVRPRFVVQAHAVGRGREKWVIDRLNISDSLRPGVTEGTFAPIDPSKYPEDWDLLTEKLVRSTYRTSTPGREIKVKVVQVDSVGEAGVTDRAYAWYRRVRKLGFAGRIMLTHGLGRKDIATTQMVSEHWRGNRNPKEKGDVPVYLLHTNKFKDIIDAGLRRPLPGPGYVHIPGWVSQAFIDELQSESRNADGTWTKHRANEAFDLLCYCEAVCFRLGLDRIDWDLPPTWAAPLSENSEVISREERQEMRAVAVAVVEAPPAPVVRERRVTLSPYLTG